MTKIFGDRGEDIACSFLESKKFTIIDRNVRNRSGEVDIIATKDGELFLVEVKTRKNKRFGLPEEYVDRKKLERIKKAGLMYKKQHGKKVPDLIRVLVVGIIMENNKPKVKLIEAD